MASQRPGNSLKSFLEVFCLNLTQPQPVLSHLEPIHAIFGQKDMKCSLGAQEDMPSCSTRRNAFLLNKKTCLLVQQEDMPSCSTRRYKSIDPSGAFGLTNASKIA